MDANDWLAPRPTNFLQQPAYCFDWRTPWPITMDHRTLFNRYRQRNWNQFPFGCCCDGYACMSNQPPFVGNEEPRGVVNNWGMHAEQYPPNQQNFPEATMKNSPHRYHSAHNWHTQRPSPYSPLALRHVPELLNPRCENATSRGNKLQDDSRSQSKDSSEQTLSNKRRSKRSGFNNCDIVKADTQTINRSNDEYEEFQLDIGLQNEKIASSIKMNESSAKTNVGDVDSSNIDINETTKMQTTDGKEAKANNTSNLNQFQEQMPNAQMNESDTRDDEVQNAINEILSDDLFQSIEAKVIETQFDRLSSEEKGNEEKNIIFLDEQGNGIISLTNGEILSLSYEQTDVPSTVTQKSENIASGVQDHSNSTMKNDDVIFLNRGVTQDLSGGSLVDVPFSDISFVVDENWDGDLFLVPGAYEEISSVEVEASIDDILKNAPKS